MNLSDQAIIHALLSGNHERERCIAFLFKKYYKFIYKVGYKYRLPKEEVLDAFTDALIDLESKIVRQKFRGQCKISTYFFSILTKKCLDRLRRLKSLRIDYVSEYEPVSDQSPGAMRQLIVQEEQEQLKVWMGQLGKDSRRILNLYYMEECKMDQIAERMGYKNAQVARNKKSKSIAELRKIAAADAFFQVPT